MSPLITVTTISATERQTAPQTCIFPAQLWKSNEQLSQIALGIGDAVKAMKIKSQSENLNRCLPESFLHVQMQNSKKSKHGVAAVCRSFKHYLFI